MAVPNPQPIWLRAQWLGRPLAVLVEWPACATVRNTSGMQGLAFAAVGPGAFVHAGALGDSAARDGRRCGSELQASTPTSKVVVAFAQ